MHVIESGEAALVLNYCFGLCEGFVDGLDLLFEVWATIGCKPRGECVLDAKHGCGSRPRVPNTLAAPSRVGNEGSARCAIELALTRDEETLGLNLPVGTLAGVPMEVTRWGVGGVCHRA